MRLTLCSLMVLFLVGCESAGHYRAQATEGVLFGGEWEDVGYKVEADGSLMVVCLREEGDGLDLTVPAGPPPMDRLYLTVSAPDAAQDALQADWYPGTQGSFVGYRGHRGSVTLLTEPVVDEPVSGRYRLELVRQDIKGASHPLLPKYLVLEGTFLADYEPDWVDGQLLARDPYQLHPEEDGPQEEETEGN